MHNSAVEHVCIPERIDGRLRCAVCGREAQYPDGSEFRRLWLTEPVAFRLIPSARLPGVPPVCEAFPGWVDEGWLREAAGDDVVDHFVKSGLLAVYQPAGVS